MTIATTANLRFATAADWPKAEAQLEKCLKLISGPNVTLAEKSFRKFRSWRGLYILDRNDCVTGRKEPPSPKTFQAFVQRIEHALASPSETSDATPDNPSEHFVIRYHHHLGGLRRVVSDLRSAIADKKGLAEARRLLDTSAECCFLCVFTGAETPKPGVRASQRGKLPVIVNSLPEQIKRIQAAKEIRIAAMSWDPLFRHLPVGSEPRGEGLFYELLNGLAVKAQCKPEFFDLSTDKAIEGLEKAELDCAFGFVETQGRRNRNMDFVAFVYLSQFIAVIKAGAESKLKTVRDLIDCKCILRSSSANHDIARDVLNIPDHQIDKVGGTDAKSPLDVLAGRDDPYEFVITDGVTFENFVRQKYPSTTRKTSLVRLGPSIAVLRGGFMIRRGQPDFAEWLRKNVLGIIGTEEYSRKERSSLGHYKDYVQRCWIPGT